MVSNGQHFRRNLFEIDNARNLSRDELVATFVPTKAFWRLLSAKNQVVLGSRGSGKTALAKMLSHDHLSKFRDRRAQEAIRSKAFIGIYVPTRLEWVGGLKKKPWQTEEEAEEFFQWRLNISTCVGFLISLRSCLETYTRDEGYRARLERELAQEISRAWSENEQTYNTLRELHRYLEDLELKKRQQWHRLRVIGHLRLGEEPAGLGFETELFAPMRQGINIVSRAMNFPVSCSWLLCLDEAEFLEPLHHRILNSYLRSHSGSLFFKIATTPYVHHTLETNTRVPLDVGHDFEYVYIDQDPVIWAQKDGIEGYIFATTLFMRRAKMSGYKYRGVTLYRLLGHSELLDPKRSDWASNSPNMALLRKYASQATIDRATRLSNMPREFSDQISRKIHGALLLRHAVESVKGRGELDIYSGVSMIIRCGDANPRRLISIFNNLLLEVKWKRRDKKVEPILSRKTQTRVLMSFSNSTLTRIQSEDKLGPQLYRFIKAVGTFSKDSLHQLPLTTDQMSSISIETDVSDENWEIIKRAVGLALLYPNVSVKNPDQMPEREGSFHLAYVLAPRFLILPRRGKARNLSSILLNTYPGALRRDQRQMKLFEVQEEGNGE